MKVVENDCVNCPQGCINCGAKHRVHYYCDKCKEDAKLYEFDGRELCAECLLEEFPTVEGSY